MFQSPLLFRVVAIILPVAVGGLLAMAGLFAARDWQARRDAHLDAVAESVDAALPALRRDLWQFDVASLRANLSNLVGRNGIQGLVVVANADSYVTHVAEGDVPPGLDADPAGWQPVDGALTVGRRALAAPQSFQSQTGRIGTLAYAVESPSFREVFAELVWENLIVFGAAGLVTLAAVIAIVWRRVIRPVEIIRDSVVGLRAGRYVPVPWQASDEIGALAADMNKLVEDLAAGARARALWHESYYYYPITGLPNRNFLIERANALIRDGAPGGRRWLLFLLDLDRFHLVNEAFGEALGDRLLAQVAECLQARLPRTGLLAHIATDQFAVLDTLARDSSPLAAAKEWATVFSEPFALQDRTVYVRASIGVAELADHADGDVFLRDADAAMHEAKHAGGGQARQFDPQTRSDAVALLKTDSALQTALARGHIKPYYQPIMDLTQRRIIGFEVLARWEDPEQGLIRPDRFIPVAEKTGTITAMAEQLLEQALADQRTVFAPHQDVALSVNLAPQQMLDHKFLKHLRDTLARESTRQLYFEITESTMMRQWAEVTRGIHSLAESGATLLLDDFGTGESSLAELHALPFDGLKIDKAFLKTAHEKADWSFVATIIALARATNLRTVAEGIEDEAHIAELTAMGCTLGQGFYFAKPLPVGEAAALLTGESAEALAANGLGRR